MLLTRSSGLVGTLGFAMHLGCASPRIASDAAPALAPSVAESPQPAAPSARRAEDFPYGGWTTLSETRTVEGLSFSPGSTLSFAQGRNDSFVLGADQSLQGLLLPKGTSGVREGPDGLIGSVRIPVDWPIQGYPFAKGVVQFLGHAKIGVLAKDCAIQGTLWKKGDRIHLDADEKNVAIRPFERRAVNGAICAAERWVWLHENGRARIVPIDKDQILQRIPCAAGDVGFYDDGKIESATLSRDHVIGGVRHTKGTQLFFDRYGHVLRQPGPLDLLGLADGRLAASGGLPPVIF